MSPRDFDIFTWIKCCKNRFLIISIQYATSWVRLLPTGLRIIYGVSHVIRHIYLKLERETHTLIGSVIRVMTDDSLKKETGLELERKLHTVLIILRLKIRVVFGTYNFFQNIKGKFMGSYVCIYYEFNISLVIMTYLTSSSKVMRTNELRNKIFRITFRLLPISSKWHPRVPLHMVLISSTHLACGFLIFPDLTYSIHSVGFVIILYSAFPVTVSTSRSVRI